MSIEELLVKYPKPNIKLGDGGEYFNNQCGEECTDYWNIIQSAVNGMRGYTKKQLETFRGDYVCFYFRDKHIKVIEACINIANGEDKDFFVMLLHSLAYHNTNSKQTARYSIVKG